MAKSELKQDIFLLLAAGGEQLTAQQLADQLGCSKETARTHAAKLVEEDSIQVVAKVMNQLVYGAPNFRLPADVARTKINDLVTSFDDEALASFCYLLDNLYEHPRHEAPPAELRLKLEAFIAAFDDDGIITFEVIVSFILATLMTDEDWAEVNANEPT